MFDPTTVSKIIELSLSIFERKLEDADANTYKKNSEIMFYELDKDVLDRDMAAYDVARRENALIEKKLEQVLMREVLNK